MANNPVYRNPNDPLIEDQEHHNVEGLVDPATGGIVNRVATNVRTITGPGGKLIKVGDATASTVTGTSGNTIATGNITAAQPTVGTPVAGGTVSVNVADGQATVEAQLTGTFSAGTTLLFEGTEDQGVTSNWFSTFGHDTGVANPPNISQIAGGASKLINIPSASYAQIRVRANPFQGGDNIAVRFIASAAGTSASSLSTNDGTFAKENGGNLAGAKTDLDEIALDTDNLVGIKTDADAINAATGTQADGAYTGSGNTTAIGGLKGLYAKLGQALNFIPYLFNGGAPGNQNNDRARAVQGFTLGTGSVSAATVGTNTFTLSSATGLQPQQWILLTGGTEEWLLTDPTYVAGSTSVITTTNILNASHTTGSWNAYGSRGPGTATFLLEGIGAQALVLNTGSPSTGILAQGDVNGYLKVNVAAGSSGGGPVTAISGAYVAGSLADGAITAIGSTTDTSATTDTGTFSLIALIKRLLGKFPAALGSQNTAASFPVAIATDQVAVAAKQSGTWLVRLQDGTGVTINSQGGSMNVNEAGTSITAVAASKSTDTVIKASAGRICGIQVTTTGANAMQIFDNASAGSGTQIGGLPASPALGYVRCPTPVTSAGITILGSATNPGITIFWT